MRGLEGTRDARDGEGARDFLLVRGRHVMRGDERKARDFLVIRGRHVILGVIILC